MDDNEHHRSRNHRWRQPDLASIVLADERPRRGGESREWLPAATSASLPGYDARSVIVLAIVVALLAAIVGWTMTLTREAEPSAPSAVAPAQVTVQRQPATAKSAGTAGGEQVVPAGVQLAPGRITATRSASGGGIVRVAVANHGDSALTSAIGADVLVLVDGQLAGTSPLGAVDATGTAAVELFLDTCPAGRTSVVAIVDSRGVVREANERDNARSGTVSFGC